MQVYLPLPEFWDTYRRDSKKHLPVFRKPEDPAEVLSNMLYYSESKELMDKHRKEYDEILKCRVCKDYNFEKGFLTQNEIDLIFGDYGIPIIKNQLVKPEELKNHNNIIYPLVVKGINKEVIHKSELNAVKLDIRNKEELLKAAEEIQNNFTKYNFEVEEFLLQPFIKLKHEVLIGGFRDPSFGPVIMFGTGGKYVEVICDTAIKSAYVSDNDINEMIDSTVIGKILKGVRGEAPCDINKLKEIIKSSAQMLIENKNISEFDLNPLIISDDNSIHAVDIRIKWE